MWAVSLPPRRARSQSPLFDRLSLTVLAHRLLAQGKALCEPPHPDDRSTATECLLFTLRLPIVAAWPPLRTRLDPPPGDQSTRTASSPDGSPPHQCLYLSQFLSGMVVVTLGPLLDSVLRDLHIPLAQGGLPALSYFCMWISAHVRERTAWALNYLGEAVTTLTLAEVISQLPLAEIPGREHVRARHVKAVVTHTPWLPAALGATAAWAGLAVTFYFVGQIMARLTAIPLTRRFLASSLLLVFAGADAMSIGAVAISPTQAVSLGLAFVAGFSISAGFSLIGSYSSRFPGWYAGVAYSVFQLSGGVGAMMFPYLIGPLAAGAGFRAALAVMAVPMLMVAFLALGLRGASEEARR